jgi:hypothetical protein
MLELDRDSDRELDWERESPPEAAAQESGNFSQPAARRADRAGLIAAGGLLAACAGLILYGVLGGGDDDTTPARTPTASVTYEVTGSGSADITYQGGSETGKAVSVDAAELPWRTTVDVPLGQDPVISITLDERGGQARCALAVRDRHVQSATAAGEFGRATCAGALPAEEDGPRG